MPSRPLAARRTAPWIVVSAVALIASVAVAVTIGPADIGLADVWNVLAYNLNLSDSAPDRIVNAMVWNGRLPRVLTAAAVGAGLALGGAVMQSVTRNPLADPFLLGLSSGASLGAASVLVLGVTAFGAVVSLPLAAFAGSLLALAATLALAAGITRGAGPTPTRTLLAGLAVGQLAAAATSFVIFWSARGDQAREVLAWLMGSIAGATWASVLIAGGALLLFGSALIASANSLDAFAFGDTAAAALGLNVARTRWLMLVGVALMTGALVSQSGSIGFVGLILPHAVRLLIGVRHRAVLPLAALTGATFLIWADTLARTVFAPRELPVGILTAAIGAPVFAAILRRNRADA